MLDVAALARGLTDAQANRVFHEQHLFDEDEEPSPAFLRIGRKPAEGACA